MNKFYYPYNMKETFKNKEKFQNSNNVEIIINKAKDIIQSYLVPIINKIDEPLEGNLFFYNLGKTDNYNESFKIKQQNLVELNSRNYIKNVLEIGFNSGFSALLILLSNPNIKLTCVDIGFHKYTIPCFLKIKELFPNRINLIINDSTIALQLLNEKFDLIHIDGCHLTSIAENDIVNSYNLSHNNTILLFDDYDAPELKDLFDNLSIKYKLINDKKLVYDNVYQGVKLVII